MQPLTPWGRGLRVGLFDTLSNSVRPIWSELSKAPLA